MALTFSRLAGSTSQSEIRNMSIECDKINGVNLSQGICDLPLPAAVSNGAIQAIEDGINQYTRYDGLEEIRSAIKEKIKKYNNLDIDQEKNIVVSGGATGALYSAFLALIDPGDEIIIFEPFYGYHLSTILAVRAVPKYVKLSGQNWEFDPAELEKTVTEKTKGILINTPANPTGKIFSKEELKKIADFSLRHDIFIFTDEIYEYFVYDGLKYLSPLSLPEVFNRTIMVSGYSKTFSITGWRVGYCVCHEKWKDMIGYMSDLVYVCAPAPLQLGVAAGINELADDFYESISKKYQAKRDMICSALSAIGLTPHVPKGAYYVLADVSSIPGSNSKEKAMYILNNTGVACVPGSAFYHDDGGENLVRFCFAKDDLIIRDACNKLKKLKK